MYRGLAQRHRIAPFTEMRRRLAADLGVEEGRISIKATTSGAMGALDAKGYWRLAVACCARGRRRDEYSDR
jgi:2C-methyl-D-erythritol 2,4-cyclodiphosphate synthase